MANENKTAVWERTSATNAIVKVTGSELYKFRATAPEHFERQLRNFLAATGATRILEVRT